MRLMSDGNTKERLQKGEPKVEGMLMSLVELLNALVLLARSLRPLICAHLSLPDYGCIFSLAGAHHHAMRGAYRSPVWVPCGAVAVP